jgi:hypothetical protein
MSTDIDTGLSLAEAARRAKVHPNTLRNAIAAKNLKAAQPNGRGAALRIFERDLSAWLHKPAVVTDDDWDDDFVNILRADTSMTPHWDLDLGGRGDVIDLGQTLVDHEGGRHRVSAGMAAVFRRYDAARAEGMSVAQSRQAAGYDNLLDILADGWSVG